MMHLPPKFDLVFQFLPYSSIILLPDAPKFTMVAVNNAHLKTVNTAEKDLMGKGTKDHKESYLSSSDNGIGMDLEYHNKIFDLFYRLLGTTTVLVLGCIV